MKKDNTRLMVYGCEITLHFCHTKEPNCIPENVEQMLLSVGISKSIQQEEGTEKSA